MATASVTQTVPLAVTKVVIPVAGLGTRMLPASKAIPKEMLPLVDKPLIHYIVEECAAAGLTEVILVTHASKSAIENYFDTHYELETTLKERQKTALLNEVQALKPANVTLVAVRQDAPKGLGHAINCAAAVVGNEPFAVVLPDVLIDNVASDLSQDNLAEMVHNFNTTGISQVMLEAVPQDKVSSYGVADLQGVSIEPGEQAAIKALVEKPAIDEAPSNLAVVGRYVFSQAIWPLLAHTKPGAGNEIQLTDAMAELLQQEQVNAYYMKGKSHDCGNKVGYTRAFIEYAQRHLETKSIF